MENKYSLFLYAADLVHFQQHLGLGADDENGMTFRELAIRLNFNGHSAAGKAYSRALELLKQTFHVGDYGSYLYAKAMISSAASHTKYPYPNKPYSQSRC